MPAIERNNIMSDYKEILEALRNLDFNTLSFEEKKDLLRSLRAHVFLLETDVSIDEALRNFG